ncbi:hypothetical protein [Ferrovibrio sp.]|uniref:hypothetical protein n=1 Tax=Ferrovibrio sp. TaxID=1917215 RepID=UPI0025BF8ACE|nr:hypothetical protein [Ferrovibrio sp.]
MSEPKKPTFMLEFNVADLLSADSEAGMEQVLADLFNALGCSAVSYTETFTPERSYGAYVNIPGGMQYQLTVVKTR